MQSTQRYWITVASKDHVQHGIAGGFIQACHGKAAPLKRMRPDDWVIFYSPKQTMNGTAKCQTFSALGKVCDENVYSFAMSEDFIPFRRNIAFVSCQEIPITSLLHELEFIADKKSWGYPFRFGFFEIGEKDFTLISNRMLNHER
ncbi:MAG TPA: EVE domain-containing protein [Ohtaekwangia sp.]|uniref:EVE domain-containing protein n=1 Tax=Ohtaekwangia sp. TaxID=2066019 RepID=UPI002F940C20